jgi:TRAP-type C4-dicarboxylate transport system substrate-binding protein
MKLPVYSRAHRSRTVALVVTLLLAAISTSAFAREFRAADTRNEDYPAVQALRYIGHVVAERSDGCHPLMSDMIKALGAQPIELPDGQVLTALSTRLIDGAENNWPCFVATGRYKRAEYYILTGHSMSPEVLVMSQKACASLSCATAQGEPATAELIERIRKVE